jgi:hypothetical protein
MIWVLVIIIPLCVEFAGWVVDATVANTVLKECEPWQEDDREPLRNSHGLPSNKPASHGLPKEECAASTRPELTLSPKS